MYTNRVSINIHTYIDLILSSWTDNAFVLCNTLVIHRKTHVSYKCLRSHDKCTSNIYITKMLLFFFVSLVIITFATINSNKTTIVPNNKINVFVPMDFFHWWRVIVINIFHNFRFVFVSYIRTPRLTTVPMAK